MESSASVGALVEAYLARLLAGNLEGLRELFAEDAVVAVPRSAPVRGDLSGFFSETHTWFAERGAQARHLRTTAEQTRAAVEWEVRLKVGERAVELPLAAVGESRDQLIHALRIYHSLWPLSGSHEIRSPLLKPAGDISLPPVVRRYHDALRAGDLDAILSTFAADGCAREPAGGEYAYCGKEALRRFYGLLFSNGGGIALEYCRNIDDGRATALEYNAVAWGRSALAPQAGVAVYERGDDGLITAARIYDDIDPPLAPY